MDTYSFDVTTGAMRFITLLAQGVLPGVPNSYRALADHGYVPRSTLHHRARARR
jgi:hypothetical protein